jgi:hypothetical protein
MHLLTSDDHLIRDLVANIIPKIAQADWPNDWAGFLPQLSSMVDSGDENLTISVLRILREFISETLTDDHYFTVVSPIMERLLKMQSSPSFRLRAKALSVFRACIEQMEMYSNMDTYVEIETAFIESGVDRWIVALDLNLQNRPNHFDELAVRLTHATCKVIRMKCLLT